MDLVSNIDLSEILHEILTDICGTICCFPHKIWPCAGAGGGPIQQQQVPFNGNTRMSYHPQIICLQQVSSAAGRRKPAAGSSDNRDYSMYQELGDCQILLCALWICSGTKYKQKTANVGCKGSFTAAIYQSWTIAWTFQSTQSQKMDTQPIIELFSPRKGWPNSAH